MKNLAYITAGYIALMMSLAQIEPVRSNVYFEMFLLIGFNAGGLLAFRAAGEHMKEDETQGSIILVGGVLIRLYTYWHIGQVFSGEMVYTMYACNSVILVFELAIFFAHWPKSEMKSLKKQANDWERYANKKESELAELDSKLGLIESEFEKQKEMFHHVKNEWDKSIERNTDLKQQIARLETALQSVPPKQAATKKKRSKSKQAGTDETAGKRFIVANHETMSQREMAEQLNVSPATINRWKKSMNGQLKPA